jgi:hypothetical protein
MAIIAKALEGVKLTGMRGNQDSHARVEEWSLAPLVSYAHHMRADGYTDKIFVDKRVFFMTIKGTLFTIVSCCPVSTVAIGDEMACCLARSLLHEGSGLPPLSPRINLDVPSSIISVS